MDHNLFGMNLIHLALVKFRKETTQIVVENLSNLNVQISE